jgi:hypothetical protein
MPRSIISLVALGLGLALVASALLVVQRPARADEADLLGDAEFVELEPAGRLTHPPIAECSGIVKSDRFEDVWWVHNDSGDAARLFAVDAEGQAIMPGWRKQRFYVNDAEDAAKRKPWPGYKVGLAVNIDWEDLTRRDDRLYIADVGNNGNGRRDLGIYELVEPNPRAIESTRILKHIPVRYPDQTEFPAETFRFDAESLFVIDGKLHLLTKHRRGRDIRAVTGGTKLYRLNTEHANRINELELIDSYRPIAAPTAAELSPDGMTLAVLSGRGVWLFQRPAQGDRWLTAKRPRVIAFEPRTAKQAEALCWDDPTTLRITNEQRDVFVLRLPDAGE